MDVRISYCVCPICEGFLNSTHYIFIPSASYALNEHGSNDTRTIIYLDDVSCYGNESKLSECTVKT